MATDAARTELLPPELAQVPERRALTTSIPVLDRLLGGFEAGRLTLIDSGSDYVFHLTSLLCVRAVMEGGEVVFVDGGAGGARAARRPPEGPRRAGVHVPPDGDNPDGAARGEGPGLRGGARRPVVPPGAVPGRGRVPLRGSPALPPVHAGREAGRRGPRRRGGRDERGAREAVPPEVDPPGAVRDRGPGGPVPAPPRRAQNRGAGPRDRGGVPPRARGPDDARGLRVRGPADHGPPGGRGAARGEGVRVPAVRVVRGARGG